MEGNSEQAQDNLNDNVEQRGEFQHVSKDGSIHFFGTAEELAAFREEENNRDNH